MTFRRFNPKTNEYKQSLRLRETVLRAPLGLTLSDEELADESKCFHLGWFDRERLRAVLLLRPLDNRSVKMRQVAVDPEFQHLGIGSQLVAFAESFARERDFTTMVAHARATAVDFYRKAGYKICGGEFLEIDIPHWLVMKEI